MSKETPNIGFDTDKYLASQAARIRQVLSKSHDKLYIEFGGKLIQDKHATRVLPGYREDAKFELLKLLCRDGKIIFVVSAQDILRGRVRGDFGTKYDEETLRTISELRKRGLSVKYIAISLLKQKKPIPSSIFKFEKKLKNQKINTYRFFEVQPYKAGRLNFDNLSINPFIDINKQLILIISPGGGSGKFGICLNQLYYELKAGRYPRYLKFETFPVRDLPLNHPVNLAYMAASADFYDIVMKDSRHGKATSYKRDLDNFELLRLLAKRFQKCGKHLRELSSATNMGINMLSSGIINDELVQKEAAAEIARRLIRYKFEVEHDHKNRWVLARVRKILGML